ncbi:isopropylmalate isomerase [Ruegeria sp. R13_0]|nr:isopropylmalate isomerase [Ruegeria sp. R13_0]MBO9433793.1 isopropylmalate isomerase [Ruegeria sp. R13_0]
MRLNVAQQQNLEDRARLRERFYGAARTVLARLSAA